jgi:hypothetical protein
LNQKAVVINSVSESDAVIQTATISPSICVAIGSGVVLKQTGTCKLRLFQSKTEEFAASETLVEFTVNASLTCVKGKLTKKVTAVKPKCPTGYTIKK